MADPILDPDRYVIISNVLGYLQFGGVEGPRWCLDPRQATTFATEVEAIRYKLSLPYDEVYSKACPIQACWVRHPGEMV